MTSIHQNTPKKNNYSIVLSIESSCDDTACALIQSNGKVLAEAIHTQREHNCFGGVVPEIAARAHLSHLPGLVSSVMQTAHISWHHIDAIAATCGPGLIGGVIVGCTFAKGLALAQNIPFIGINHIEAHALTVRIPKKNLSQIPFPYLLFLASGGHCQTIVVNAIGQYTQLGGTVDDAAGEVFDKVAKMLGLPWPGGPALESLAKNGNENSFTFPKPLFNRKNCDFSFSGLKTAVSNLIDDQPYTGSLPKQLAADIAASFQKTITETIINRLQYAIEVTPQITTFAAAGGVASNTYLRQKLFQLAEKNNLQFVVPPIEYCTDNAVMIGWTAIEKLILARTKHIALDDISLLPRPRWPLSEISDKPIESAKDNL
ncbi:tRNA (adenosine(37)-N6)-threonylcarbamoyltransferase complex transferase subunit TsaD [Commensalibacter sp. Nvir]|uniref:tRNA (adenosine(37)-N6)-threonylcarbamoyltransferase complex transferase subunit TsaD n=1 Tax=Commensalibacter sp. Nvir TaxID=3069817 RepID=UPI0030C834B0